MTADPTLPAPTSAAPRPPSVQRVLGAVTAAAVEPRDHVVLVEMVRDVLDDERARLALGDEPRAVGDLAADVLVRLDAFIEPAVTSVINATGVIIHTNLGRAPWPPEAATAATAAGDYLLLEIDRATGRRGARFRRAEEHLIALTGADDAYVTNNNAAALALACALAGRGGVVVSRGELVEIGGGVRIPDIIRRAGAKLIEVGTTNRTRAADYEAPLAEGRAKAVLRVHASNFTMAGFVETPDPSEVARLAHDHRAIVIDDLGSGALLPTERFGLAHEPMPRERLTAGADLVTFSGDKLVGGPQAGLIVGRADLIARIRRDPLARAMRPDKATLLGVTATLGIYRAGLAETRIPVWTAIAVQVDELRVRAARVAAGIGERAKIVELESTIGGGSLPGQTLPSAGITIEARSATRLLSDIRLRGPRPVIGRIEGGRVLLDLRTVQPEHDQVLASIVAAALAGGP